MEVGFNSPSRKRETSTPHTSQAQKVTRQGRHKGAGKGTTSSLLTKWNIVWGPSHTPFGGMRWLVDSYSRCGCGADSAPRHNHTPTCGVPQGCPFSPLAFLVESEC
eukprot:scaffold1008_cov96-Isochrysis_galbana.AAC.2